MLDQQHAPCRPRPAGRAGRPAPRSRCRRGRTTARRAGAGGAGWPGRGPARAGGPGPWAACRPAGSARWLKPDQGQDAVGVGGGVGAVAGPAAADLGGGEHVLADRQRAEDLEALERAGDAEPGALVRLQRGHVGAVEADAAAVEALQPADGVEAGRLPGAVGADQAGDDAGRDVEVHAPQRVHTPKSNLSFRYLQKRHRFPPIAVGPVGPGRWPRHLNFFLVGPGIFRRELERLLIRCLTVPISGRTR